MQKLQKLLGSDDSNVEQLKKIIEEKRKQVRLDKITARYRNQIGEESLIMQNVSRSQILEGYASSACTSTSSLNLTQNC